MIRTLDDKKHIEIKEKINLIAEGQKQELHDTWHNRSWPEQSWNKFVQNQFIFEDNSSVIQNLTNTFSALEGWARGTGDSSFCTSLIVHYLLCRPIIDKHFPDYHMEHGSITCFALTERSGGSTPLHMSVSMDSHLNLVNGEKWHITNAPVCDHFLVFGKDKNSDQLAMAIVPADQEGIEIETLYPEGLKNSPVGRIVFKNAYASHIIVSTSKVQNAIKDAFQAERLAIGFVSTGIIEHHLHKLVSYLRKRTVGGTRIIKHQYLQKRLTDIKISLETLKSLINCTIRSIQRGDDISAQASKIKILGIDLVKNFAEQAMKCYGSYGVQKELGLMQILNDSMCASIAGGTEEIHRNVIFSYLLRESIQEKKSTLAYIN